VHLGGQAVELTPAEFDLLAALMRNAGRRHRHAARTARGR
jgi:DNA-binding response OmpR family regulator